MQCGKLLYARLRVSVPLRGYIVIGRRELSELYGLSFRPLAGIYCNPDGVTVNQFDFAFPSPCGDML